MNRFFWIIALLAWASSAWAGMSAPRKLVVAGGGGASYSDNFNRANESPISSPWVSPGPWHEAMSIDNSKAKATQSSSDSGAYYNASLSANQYSQAVFDETYCYNKGVAVRMSSSVMEGYVAIATGTTSVSLEKFVNDAWVGQIGSTSSVDFTGGKIIRIEAEGTTVRVKVDGSTVISVTDTSISSGFSGIWAKGGHTIDDWAGGDL